MGIPGCDASTTPAVSSILVTPLLCIRPLCEQDLDVYRDLYCSAEAMEQIGPPLVPEVATAAFEAACRHNLRGVPGHRFWAVLSRAKQEPVGVAALRRSGELCEFGLMLVPQARDRRHAPEAVAAIVDHAFSSLGVRRFRVECLDNSMVRLVRRLVAPHGFHRAEASDGLVAWELHRDQWQGVGVDG
ncbi:GNAT family N-acetyltransferase [Lysobacter claricitrinus]|uniref:GNAT family N-acetyltransferase n=1 Tax=Lysobacter claricitrinus TaxID=3367728 RepID=UPI0038B25BF9